MSYILNVPEIDIKLKKKLDHDSYLIPFEFPLVIYREGIDIEMTEPILLDREDVEINLPNKPNDLLLKIRNIHNKPFVMNRLKECENDIDYFRKPWVKKRIIELSEELGESYLNRVQEYTKEFSQCIFFPYILGKYYLRDKKYDEAYYMLLQAYNRCGLFWEKDIKNEILEEFLNICKYTDELQLIDYNYVTKKYELGLKIGDYLIINTPEIQDYKTNWKKLRCDYIPKLKTNFRRYEKYDINTKLTSNGHDKYLPLNPSVIENKDGKIGAVRTVNYTRINGMFCMIGGDVKMTSISYFLDLDDNNNITRQREILWTAPNPRGMGSYMGIEDVRLINKEYFTATIIEITPTNLPTICLCHYNYETGEMDRIIPLVGKDPNRPEKNWLPFIVDNQLYIIYEYSPFTIYRIDLETGQKLEVIIKELNLDLRDFRGSAPPIPYQINGEDGYLFSIHEVLTISTKISDLRYSNRLLWMDKNFNIKYISRLFLLDNRSVVEFMMSITMKDDVVSFWMGIEDQNAVRYDINKKDVDNLLHWIQIENKQIKNKLEFY